MTEKSAVRTYICCWLDLIFGRACFIYNCLFSPFILAGWACNIYLCTCARIYFQRSYYYICCCFCRTLNCCWMYTDKSFPPDETSLGKVGGDKANKASGHTTAKCTWCRAGSVSKGEKMQLFADSVNSKDICQGALGDCWLLAAMACLAEHSGAIDALFRTKERNPRGKYRLRLFNGVTEEWEKILIDDFIPCDEQSVASKNPRPLFTRPNQNELWVMLLEKAFAKFCGNYAALEGGTTIWAIRAMTGDPARSFEREDSSGGWKRLDLENKHDKLDKRAAMYKVLDERIKHDDMFEILAKYSRMGSVLCASGASGVAGLISGHAYSILTVKRVKKTFRMVKIRNPWGSGEWLGPWSDKSDMWTKHADVKKALGFTPQNDGAFWMCWEDFLKHWSTIGVVDRTVDVNTLRLQVEDDSGCAPCQAVASVVASSGVWVKGAAGCIAPTEVRRRR
eukprot:CAMPEP_0194542008 /NCGR_PEP_ID=MMETSP0253-20130528/83263_1 /TAXON_ID=2966 /ORGANISM="Noctiluca scintillans" /LENGTH=450 /DNA_ID=CAMNT_0039388577 /DNA_START=28 /DNA_END=1381 /DNA_ORIENTATION=-